MIDIDDVKRLQLAPGELLVVKVDGVMSDDARKRVEALFAAQPLLTGRVLVIDRLISLSVIGKGDVVGVDVRAEMIEGFAIGWFVGLLVGAHVGVWIYRSGIRSVNPDWGRRK